MILNGLEEDVKRQREAMEERRQQAKLNKVGRCSVMALLLLFSFTLSRLYSPFLLFLLLLPLSFFVPFASSSFSFLSLFTHRGNARPHLTRPPLHPPPVLILRKTAHLPRKSQSSQPRKLSQALELEQRQIFLMEQHLTDHQVERVAVTQKWALSLSPNHPLLVLVTLGLAPWCPQLLRRLER